MPMRDAPRLKPGEKVYDLGFAGLAIIQGRKRTRFGDDAVLLAHFCTLGPSDRAVDLGTGTGIIALLLAGREPQCRVDALELRPDAADRAARSVSMNALCGRVRVYECDLRREPERLCAHGYDLAVCNPPYYRIGEGKISPDPDIAAARHEVSCTLGDVVRVSASLLREGGRLALILPWTRREECGQTLARFGFQPQRFRPVVHQEGEPAGRFLLESVKGGADRCAALLPLIQYDAHGRFTAEMARIYHMDDEGRQ